MSDLFPSPIETERLHLERLDRESVDVRRLHDVCSVDEDIADVTAFLPWSPHETLADTDEMLRTAVAEWEAGERARYAIRLRESEPEAGELAGVGQLVPDWDRRSAMLGLWLRSSFWGRSYATEHDATMCELAFDHLGLAVFELKAHVDNEASHRAIERLVDRFDGQLEGRLANEVAYDDGTVATQRRYTIHRDQWLAATGGGTDIVGDG